MLKTKLINQRFPKYKVTESFNWLKCYYPWSYTDTIGVAWSGGFAYSTNSKSITYYNMLGTPPSFKWAKTSKESKQALADGTPAKGCKYNFCFIIYTDCRMRTD